MKQRVLIVLGTRPEAIKLAPVIRALAAQAERFDVHVCSTGQHETLVVQVLDLFGIALDSEFSVMSRATSLASLTSAIFDELDPVVREFGPDWVVVQGDTTSAMVGALTGFYNGACVAHVEAGLRTWNRAAPFPEEANRNIIAQVADRHYAPTVRAQENLLRQGIAANSISVTGNTVVDALLWARSLLDETVPDGLASDIETFTAGRRLILATSHRRESFGHGLENICSAINRIVAHNADVVVVFPVHPNPAVLEPIHRLLGGQPRIRLLEPLPYLALVWLLNRAHHVLTDSGGIQEEAASVGKPVLVMRETTERSEIIELGVGALVGIDASGIASAVQALLDEPERYSRMAQAGSAFGDGKAAQRIAGDLAQ